MEQGRPTPRWNVTRDTRQVYIAGLFQEKGGGGRSGSLSEGKGTEAALKERKESRVSWWETSTVLGRRCKGERSQRRKGTGRWAEAFK